MTDQIHPVRRLAQRVLAMSSRMRGPQSLATRRLLLLVAAVVFAVATVLAWRALPNGDSPLAWPPLLVVALLGVPALLVLNSVEYLITVRAVGGRMSLPDSLRLNVVASAANLLPVPGSIMVRIQGLRNTGATYAASTASTAVVGVTWISLSLLAAGGLQVAVGERRLGSLVFLAGIGLLVLVWTMARLQPGVSYTPRLAMQLLLVEMARVGVLAIRLHLLLVALGAVPTVAQSMALTISVVVATAVAVFPGGLGIRELTAAAIGPLVGLPASVSLLAVALDWVLNLAVLGVAAGVLAVTRKK
jgi:uncharacterized membrane protein YbhN (UPF0104 family)